MSGVPLQILRSYDCRKQSVSSGIDTSSIELVNNGVPQDSVVDPLMFITYINDILPYLPLINAQHSRMIIQYLANTETLTRLNLMVNSS